MGTKGDELGIVSEPSRSGKQDKRFVEGGGENIEHLVLERIWSYKEKIFDKKRNKGTDNMMRNISDACEPRVEGAKIHMCKGSGS